MMALAAVVAIVLVSGFGVLFIHTFGKPFLIAANSSSGLPHGIAFNPTYISLMSAVFASTPVTVIVVAFFLLYFLAPVYAIDMTVTRTIFAYAFDGLLPRRLAAVEEQTRTPWWAIGIAWVLTELTFLISLQLGNFFQILVYATLIFSVSMVCVGICAAIVPWRKPELYRAGATQKKVLGLPVVTVAGVCSVVSLALVWTIYFVWSEQFGLTHPSRFVLWLAGTVVAALIFFNLARLIQRRRGTEIELAYSEIPPE
jgi:amino acid transporter